MNRRRFIRVIGAGGVIVAGSAVGLTRCDRMPAAAIAGWDGPGAGEREPRRWALAHAILAPNPHNMQSWIADIGAPETITLFVDRDRLLPETDPHGRQIVIGCGCFLELLVMALAERGYAADVAVFPDGGGEAGSDLSKPFARIRLRETVDVARDPLFRQIPLRRSNKEPYDAGKPLTSAHAAALAAAYDTGRIPLRFTEMPADLERIRDIAARAMMLEMETPRTHKESIDRVRIGADAIARHRDGIDLNGPMFWWMNRLGLITPESMTTPGTMAWRGGIDYAMGWLNGTPGYGWMTTADNDRVTQLAVGRAYVRLNLQATALGVGMHPNSQALQEYPEMATLRRELLEATGTAEGHTLQMLFRLGYAPPPPPSPRRAPGDIVRA